MIRVFPHRNKWTPSDDLAFIGWPPLIRPTEQPVYISIVFTWDIPLGQRLYRAWSDYYSDVHIGGPALGDPGGQFVPGRFIKNGGTITSRGCPKCCPWCFVPQREGPVRELDIVQGNIVQDNNLLACSRGHILRVFDMLKQQKGVVFSGGIDVDFLRDWHRPLFDEISLKEIWVACDTEAALPRLERAARILDGISINKKRCYAMIGFNGETLALAEDRLERIYEMGFLPFAQLYQSQEKIIYDYKWRALARKWCRPAAYRQPTRRAPDQKERVTQTLDWQEKEA